MGASSVNFDKTKTMWNMGYVWLNCAVPAVDSIITVVANSNGEPTPDSTENPSAVHLGYTDKGTKCSYKFTKTDATDDEHYMPHDMKITAESMSIEGGWKQLLDSALLVPMSVGGTLTSPTGGKLVQFGGLDTITPTCIAVFAPKKNDATKFIQFVIFSGYNTEGVEWSNTKEGEAVSPFKFEALAVSTRAKGKQSGYIYTPT